MSNSLQPHALQHARPPCLSPTPGTCSNSCPLSQWCHPSISSSVSPFSSYLQSFPTSGSFQMSQFFASGGQRIGVLASASILLMNIQDWFPKQHQHIEFLERNSTIWKDLGSGLPRWHSNKESTCQCRRCGFDPWVGKMSWRRKWQPTPVLLPRESPWTDEPGGS